MSLSQHLNFVDVYLPSPNKEAIGIDPIFEILTKDIPVMYTPFLIAFLIAQWLWLFLTLFTFLLLWKGRLLWTRFGNPHRVESHVIESKGGSKAATQAGCEDSIDGGWCGSLYDVFLSFRGPDTRDELADVLYEFMRGAGIHVFRDYEELRCGDEIAGGIRRAIYGSKIYVVIFSRTYATSSWCLRELAMIAKCHIESDGNKKIIMPLFHHVDPDDVKLKTNLYQEAIDGHRLQYEADIVQEWEDALKTVAHISGLVTSGIQGLGKLARLVVQDVLRLLKIRERYVPDYLTEIDDQVEGVMKLLDRDSSDVLFIVLHGMGGIGKTILASVVFNNICSWFEGCSFVTRVREFSLKSLAKKLLADILNGPCGEVGDDFDGINEIRRRFCEKKVLIVLDDVNRADQLMMFAGHSNCLGAGSRVLVTTRDVAEAIIGFPRDVVRTFEIKLQDDHRALQIFTRRAFGSDFPPPKFLDLSMEIVRASGNLPLALEAVAEQFRKGKDWRGMLEKLKQVPHKEVMDALNISYDELDDRQKQIFLDIACFHNMRKSRATTAYMWEACNFYPIEGIHVLVNKSLIKIIDDDIISIHKQLQAFGKEHVHQESPLILRNRSRIWNPEDAWIVIQSKEVSENVAALDLGSISEDRSLTREDFASFPYLRYLDLCGGVFVGDFEDLFSQLRWLRWRNCPEICPAMNLKMEHLTILEISGLKIRDGWFQSLMSCNLKVLELSECFMTTTPDLSACSKLERLILGQNRLLEEIHPSLGKLQGLIYLEIQDCPSLRGMPPELHSLGALAVLRLGSLIYQRDQLHSLEFYPPVSSEIPPQFLEIVYVALGRLYTSLRSSTRALLRRLLYINSSS